MAHRVLIISYGATRSFGLQRLPRFRHVAHQGLSRPDRPLRVGSSRSRSLPLLVVLRRCEVRDGVGRSYFDIPTGQSQLFSENSSHLLVKSDGRSPVPQYFSSHLFQKVT